MATAVKHKKRSRVSHHKVDAMNTHTFAEMSRFNLSRHFMRKESNLGAMIAGLISRKIGASNGEM